MASRPTSSDHRPRPVETESAVFAKVAALLLGILVAVLGLVALLMWADAAGLARRRSTAEPRPPATTTRPITTSRSR